MNQAAQRRTLVLMAGLPGTGKTTLAFALAKQLQWPVLSKDTLKTSLLSIEIVDRVAGFAAYELLFALAHDILVKQQVSAIIDTSALYPFIVHRSSELARQIDAQLKVVHCIADYHVREQRISKRTTTGMLTSAVPLPPDEEAQLFSHLPTDTLVLPTTEPLDTYLQHVTHYILGNLRS